MKENCKHQVLSSGVPLDSRGLERISEERSLWDGSLCFSVLTPLNSNGSAPENSDKYQVTEKMNILSPTDKSQSLNSIGLLYWYFVTVVTMLSKLNTWTHWMEKDRSIEIVSRKAISKRWHFILIVTTPNTSSASYVPNLLTPQVYLLCQILPSTLAII